MNEEEAAVVVAAVAQGKNVVAKLKVVILL